MNNDSKIRWTEINPPLDEASNMLAEWAMTGARKCFEEDGGAAPMLLFVRDGRPAMAQIPGINSEFEKDAIAFAIQKLREVSDGVVFITEVWMSHARTDTPEELERIQKMLDDHIPPSDDPHRVEAVNLCIYTKSRMVMIFAIISRNPNKLGEWMVMHDSLADTDGKFTASGRFVKLEHGFTDLSKEGE